MSASVPLLRIEGLTVRYGSRTALHGVDFEVRPGELVALAGPNGSGKTTLIRSALGLVAASSGRVRLGDSAVEALGIRERARRAAWVPQEEAPQDNVEVREYVLYGRFAHLPPFTPESAADRAAATQALAEVGLADRARSGILELSGGERQRLLLARALAQEAPLVLLDEPTAHLDIGHQLDLLGRVRRQVAEGRVGAVAALHDLNLASRFADRVVVLSFGRVVAEGTPDAVLTPGLLRDVWGVEAERQRDPRTGTSYLVPYRALGASVPGPPPRRGRLVLIGGGGAAAPFLDPLLDAGWQVTVGVVPLLDSDADAAESRGVPIVGEVPFSPIGERALAALRERIEAADAVLVAPIAVGPGNLANLELLRTQVGRRPIYWIEPGEFGARDFTNGRASVLRQELLDQGARPFAGIGPVLEELERVHVSRDRPAAAPPIR